MPATSLVGLWDWWPSWAVYSSRPAIVQMMVHQKDVEHLPAMLQRHVAPPQPLSAWCPVNLDGWSYDTCQCPMYPQLRYRLAIIAALAESSDIDLQVTVRSSPDRWTGERIERTFSSDQLSQTLQDYWVNTTQRQGLTRREPPPVEQRQSGR